MKHDISKLESLLDRVESCVSELHRLELKKQLVPIMRQPWWTTVAEFLLVANTLETMVRNLEGQIQQSQQLLEASRQVGQEAKSSAA